ncbi:SixA phosphatase family protein [Lichenihabitans psoromatis]|uniref:SixA phosphatase family protein n=1 Tax=Lichenihabitans psoromatis TaxID=2528642 RepID=UPI0013F14A28|nr:histidine phosphatase family protein [Lichenihabitans psoromatis]
MKRLLLLRHAKAEMAPNGQADHDRRLSSRGLRDAREVGAVIERQGWSPDFMLVSDAARTRETLEQAMPQQTASRTIEITPALYDATAPDILALIRTIPDTATSLLVIGHNPGIGELARQLAAAGSLPDLHRLATRFPTSALAVIALSAEHWADVGAPQAMAGEDQRLEALVWSDPSGKAD